MGGGERDGVAGFEYGVAAVTKGVAAEADGVAAEADGVALATPSATAATPSTPQETAIVHTPQKFLSSTTWLYLLSPCHLLAGLLSLIVCTAHCGGFSRQ